MASSTSKNETRNHEPDLSHFGLGILLRDAYFALRRCSNAYCAQIGCNGDQFVVLKYLADESGLTQQDLAVRCGHDSSTIGSMLRSLENRGLITRVTHPSDKRAKLVQLTKEGLRIQRKLWKQTEVLRKNLWTCLPAKDREVVAAGLRRITASMTELKDELN